MVDKVRAFVTFAVVVLVGVYVMDRLAGGSDRVPSSSIAGESYVNARGVIDAAKRITKHSAGLPLADRLGKGTP